MILIADNIRMTDPAIGRAIERAEPVPIRHMAKICERAGADAIDINAGPLSKNPEKMAFLVETVQSVTDLPILIDTANPAAMEAGLRGNRKTAIINGFSLEPKKLEAILPLAEKYDADIIGYLLRPDGHVPPDASERLGVAVDLFGALESAGIDKSRLIIDPIIVPIMWQNGNRHAMHVLAVIRALPDLLGYPVRTIAALSNLTSGKGEPENKRLLEKAYLPMLSASGLSMLMLNARHAENVRIAKMCAALSDPKVFCWEERALTKPNRSPYPRPAGK